MGILVDPDVRINKVLVPLLKKGTCLNNFDSFSNLIFSYIKGRSSTYSYLSFLVSYGNFTKNN